MIFRTLVWLNPPNAPINAENVIEITKKKDLWVSNKNKGAIFCQVTKIKQFIQFVLFIIEGSQKWNGAAPNFVRSEIVIIRCEIVPNGQRKGRKEIKIPIKSIDEAKACNIKYFIGVSLFELNVKIGIIDIKFNSNPIQIVNHIDDDTAKHVPKIKVNLKINIIKI